MKALVKFDNNEFLICESKLLFIKNGEDIVRVRGGRYKVQIIAKNCDEKMLNLTKQWLERKIGSLQSKKLASSQNLELQSTPVPIPNTVISSIDPVVDSEFEVTQSPVENQFSKNISYLNVTNLPKNTVCDCEQSIDKSKENYVRDNIQSKQNSDLQSTPLSTSNTFVHSFGSDKYENIPLPAGSISSKQIPSFSDINISQNTDSIWTPNKDNSSITTISQPNDVSSLRVASTEEDSIEDLNILGHSAPDDAQMFVKTVESGTKRDYCIYCKTNQAKLSRHVIRHHYSEESVQQYLSLPKGSKERKIIMANIRKKGHYYFNMNLNVNNGERKVIRRPKAEYRKRATDFATCPQCFGDYSKNSFRHHVRRCKKKGNIKPMVCSKKVTGRIHSDAGYILRRRVFPTMQEDDVVRAIRYDQLVILFGNKLCQKYKDPHFYDMIRQKLRQLGRFLIELRTHNTGITDFFSVFHPTNYDSVVATVQSLAGLNDSETGFKKPSLATSLGTLIKQIGRLCVSERIKRQDKEQQALTEDFLKLLTEDFNSSIARTALETHSRINRQKKVILPSKDDISKFQIHLRNEVRKSYHSLRNSFSVKAWVNLASSVLTSLLLFNRRRPGEMERILIKDFINYEKIDANNTGEAFANFSQEEKVAAEKYVRLQIRGKLNRTVPVLIHKELTACIKLLIKFRELAKVDKKNPYVFGIEGNLKGDHKYLRACNLMRRYAVECGASKPETLRATILRKHVATSCINFNLTDNEVSDLANFMGHADKIHKSHYRQPIITREILHISKLLETVQGSAENLSDFTDTEDEMDPTTSNPVNSGSALEVPNAFPSKTKRKRSTSPYGPCKRKGWSQNEKKIVLDEFKLYIRTEKLPSLKFIQDVIARNSLISKRNPASIKTWISNQIRKGKI